MSSLDNYEIIPAKKICQRARDCKDIKKREDQPLFTLFTCSKIVLSTNLP